MGNRKLHVRKYVVFVISILMMTGLLFVVAYANPRVSFIDPGLEAAVRIKIGKEEGAIRKTDLRAITELDAQGREIRSLEGIRNLSRLVSLNLEDNMVEDVSELAELSMLKVLNLCNNGIADLEEINFEAVEKLKLRELSLRHNMVELESGEEIRLSDISLLSEIRTLEFLELRDNHIRDISPLEGHTELFHLDISQNPIRNFLPLTEMEKLTYLNLRETGIRDIEILSKMHDLVYLNLHSNEGISSIESLKEHTALVTLILEGVNVREQTDIFENKLELERLNLSHTGIENIEFLRNIKGLRHLELRGSRLKDIEVLSAMKDLEILDLGNTGIRDIGALRGHFAMKELDLRHNDITDITPIEGFTGLTYLNLHSNMNIGDVSLLNAFTNLETLIMRNVPVRHHTDIFEGMSELRILNLSNTGIQEIGSLKGASKIRQLELSNNEIEDISSLKVMGKLEILDLGNNRIGCVEALKGLNCIQELDLRGNGISDIEPLRDLTELQYLNLNGNTAVASVEPIAGFTKLETLILKHVPVGDQFYVFEGLKKLKRVNVENTGILDETVFARLELEGSLVREGIPAYGEFAMKLPSFSHNGGLYHEAFELELETDETSGQIFYTLNGSEPTKNAMRYTEPLKIPKNNVTVVRAKVYDDEENCSPVVTHTYFNNPTVFERNDLPLISISTADSNLFDPVRGIYTENNRWMDGREWERPIHIEMYEDNGDLAFRQNAGIRIHGAYTRTLHQKSLKLYARPEYDNQNYFNAEIFPGLKDPIYGETKDRFKRLILRTSGNDYNSALFRDALVQSIVEPIGTMTTQAYRPAVLFVNGRYWGVHNLREMYGTHYLAQTFDVAEEDVVILENDWKVDEGDPEDAEHYKDMLDYIRTNGLKTDEHYDYISTQMDLENFRDYLIAETFFGNTDWPHNNIRYWRTKTDEYLPDASYGKDGRWRWMLYDMDFAFSRHFVRVDRFGSRMDHTHDTLTWALSPFDGLYGGLSWPNFLFRAVMENETFRQDFISRYADLMNSYFRSELMVERIDMMKKPIEPEIPDHIRRWGVIHTVSEWNQTIEKMNVFARERGKYMRQHLNGRFKLGGSVNITLEAETEQGYIQINTIEIREGLPGHRNDEAWTGIYFKGIPVTLVARPQQGYSFSHWEGAGIDSSEELLEIAPTEDMSIRAVFIRNNQ